MCHAIRDNHTNVMVVEDDCKFAEPLERIEEAIRLALDRPDFKAILLACYGDVFNDLMMQVWCLRSCASQH